MTDGVELKMRYIGMIRDLLATFGPLIDDEPVVHGIPRGYSTVRPPPQPWRFGGPSPMPWRHGVAQRMGEALVRAAQLKVVAKMAGNDELAGAADKRIGSILDDDWCGTYPRIIKMPPIPPFWTEPPPRPDEMGVSWQGFEVLIGTLMDYQAGLPDGALKDELAGIVVKCAMPG